MADRLRHPRKPRLHKPQFVNPYPEMSVPEALVRLELESRHIPFSWRFFDGVSPTATQLVPDLAPEFTLREYHIVILILTTYFGTLPGILDKNGLIAATLEADGWKVIVLWDTEIRTRGPATLLNEKAPELLARTFQGPMRPNPYNPNLMQKFREKLQQLNFARSKPGVKEGGVRDSSNRRRRERRRIRRDIRMGNETAVQDPQRSIRRFIRRG